MPSNTMKKQVLIKPKSSWKLSDIVEIWQYRELFYIFTWRDLKIRYRQTILGIIYVVFQPVISMVIFTVFFGNLAKIPSGSIPYSLFVIIGLVFWNYFSGSLMRASNSMIENENIITKVYFPKIILPISSVVTFFVDFLINTALLFIIAASLGYPPNIMIFAAYPFAILITTVTAIGMGLFLSSLNVKYRDIRNILPFGIQILLFLSPVIYPLTIVSDRNKYLMALNPLTSAVEIVRSSFTSSFSFNPQILFISVISSLAILGIGIWYFKRTQAFFADIV